MTTEQGRKRPAPDEVVGLVSAEMALAFPKEVRELKALSKTIWQAWLAKWPPALLLAAWQRVKARSDHYGSGLVRMVERAMGDIAAEAVPDVLVFRAWAQQQIRRHGYMQLDRQATYPSPAYSSMVEALGGWMVLCQADDRGMDRLMQQATKLVDVERQAARLMVQQAPERVALPAGEGVLQIESGMVK